MFVSLCLPDPGSGPESPQGAAFQHRQKHGVNDNEARRPVVNAQPVPSKLRNQLVRKQQVLDEKLSPLSPAGLQLINTGTAAKTKGRRL